MWKKILFKSIFVFTAMFIVATSMSSCSGGGHCSTCNNADGKCTNCKGEGYLYFDYILSPSSLEFSQNGGDKLVSITTYKKWKP